MRARVVNYPSVSITACTGVEFVRYEWRNVPPGREAEAERHPYLEIEQVEPELVPEPEPVEAEPVSKPKSRPTNGRRRRKTTPKGSK